MQLFFIEAMILTQIGHLACLDSALLEEWIWLTHPDILAPLSATSYEVTMTLSNSVAMTVATALSLVDKILAVYVIIDVHPALVEQVVEL